MNGEECREQLRILYEACGFNCGEMDCLKCPLCIVHKERRQCLYYFIADNFGFDKYIYCEDTSKKIYHPEEFKDVVKNLTSRVDCGSNGGYFCANCIKIKNNDFNRNCLYLIIVNYWS